MSISTLSRGRFHAPREPLADLVARVDLAALVEQYAGPGRRSGASVLFRCPNHSAHKHGDRSPSFEVNTRTNRARCYGPCGFSGDALDLVKWREGLDTGRAAERLRAHLGEWESPAPITRAAPAAPVRRERRAPLAAASSGNVPEEVKARYLARYCAGRGWPLSVVETFGLEVVLDTSGALRVRHNYFAPTDAGEWVAVWAQDRATGASGAKWLSTSGVAALPYNLRSLEADALEAVVITEGPADAITAALALENVERVAVIGVPGANGWREEWAQLVEGLAVIICRDDDDAGAKFARNVAGTLSSGAVVVTPGANDLCDLLTESGLDAVRGLLLDAIEAAAPSETGEPDTEKALRLLFEAFPGSQLAEGGAGDE